MEYTSIPGASLNGLSRVALGTWAIGGWMWGGTEEEQSIRTIGAAIERGINVIDTAPVYGFGRSEEIVGRALRRHIRRHQVFVSTKTGLDWKEGMVFRNCSAEFLRRNVEDSLGRLGIEYIDILFVHWPDPAKPFEETGRVMREFLDSGKARAIGVSNFSPEQMDAFRRTCPIHVCQPPYNLFERGIEADVLPYCRENGIPLMTYGALCRGLLSGKMAGDREFAGDDLRKVDPKFQEPRFSRYLEAVERLRALAGERCGKGVLPFAVRWVLDQGSDIALWGGRRPEQMDAVREVTDWRIDEETMAEIDRIIAETIPEPVGPEFMAPPARRP
ncbi:MAG: aldo/keto reductase [Nitrospirota bacterium]|jgi:aryl-alcohol dehydrogenase-like predicted oxidoreductase